MQTNSAELNVGSSVSVKWSDGKIYLAEVLSTHYSPCYIVSAP